MFGAIAVLQQAASAGEGLRVSTPIRTSTASGSPSANTRGRTTVRIDEFIEATSAGRASEKHRRLDELTDLLARGDRLIVTELSRLGRSLGQAIGILDALAKAGVKFVALKENIRVDGKRDIQTKVSDDAFRPVRRGRARPDLRANARGPRPGTGVREARPAEGLTRALEARRGIVPFAVELREWPLPVSSTKSPMLRHVSNHLSGGATVSRALMRCGSSR